MKNSIAPIIVFMVVGLWFLVSAVSGERTEQPRRPYFLVVISGGYILLQEIEFFGALV